MVRDLARLTVVAVAAALVVAGWTTWRIWDQGSRDEQRPVDAIVVLGAAQYDGRPSPVLRARIAHAIELYHAGVAPVIVVTGGKADGDRTTEAAAARDYALAHDVPAEAILVEDRGRTTLESMRSVAAILADNDLRTAVFVSDRSHMLRVLRIADDLSIDAFGSPTATSPTDTTLRRRFDATIHEIGALALYFLAGQTD